MNNTKYDLSGFKLAPLEDPYLIAEIGVNHEGSLETAKLLIDQAKEGGANAAKFQTYKAESLASKNSPSYWDTDKEETKSQYELFKKYDKFNEEQFIELSEYCKKIDIDFISTPFDEKAVEFLDSLMPFFKIASADITNVPLLRKTGGKNKPIILSTGASTLGEIDTAIKILEDSGAKNIILLHCILNYPTSNENAHLKMIKSLIKCFPNYLVGYSDHTLPNNNMTPLVTAWLLGAVVLEKHFTNNKSLPGNDHYHAMDKNDIINFKKEIKLIKSLLGKENHKKPINTEGAAINNARRSIVLKTKVNSGEILSDKILTCKRPGTGISSCNWDRIIGRRIRFNLDEDHILQWSDIED